MRFLDGAIKVMQRPVGPVLLVALMVSALVAATVGFAWRWWDWPSSSPWRRR